MRVSLFVLTILVFTFTAHAQSTITRFDVYMDKDKIGELIATRNVSGKKVVKNLSTNTDAKVLLLNIHVESEIYATFENDVLLNSFAYRHVNRGSDNIETTVKRASSSTYKVVKNGEAKILQKDNIKFSVVDLYFKEPKGLSSIFSNTHGEFIKISQLSEGVYQLVLPDGKTNTFIYQNGKLIKVEAKLLVGIVVFKRK